MQTGGGAVIRRVLFGETVVSFDEGQALTTLPDGFEVHALPHDTDSYRETARRLGYGADVAQLCIEHELTHSWLLASLGQPCCPALHAVAHGLPETVLHGLIEDAVMAVQRLANALGVNLADHLAPP